VFDLWGHFILGSPFVITPLSGLNRSAGNALIFPGQSHRWLNQPGTPDFDLYLQGMVNVHPLRSHIESVCKLTNEEFEYVLTHFTVVKYKKHTQLVREGDLVRHEYFVMKGCLRSYITDSNTGKEFTYGFAAEHWWISERESFTKRVPAATVVECLEDCELLALTYENRMKLGRELWKYEHYVAEKLSLGYVALQKRMQLMIMGSAKERFENFIQQYPLLYNRVPKTMIASYLGVSRETISRLYRK
jgi:CRP/FNR family transcriptional regulator, cyclic AMP receptor protein